MANKVNEKDVRAALAKMGDVFTVKNAKLNMETALKFLLISTV